MKFPELVPATFVKRDNRFVASLRLENGSVTTGFVPTTGRLTGVLKPGCRVWVARAQGGSGRKTPFDLVLSELEDGGLCCVKAINANYLFEEAVQLGRLDDFPCSNLEKEVTYGRSRLDFRLTNGDQRCWVEVKSVTYVENGVGMFPDAPTSRGEKHLQELAKLAAKGDRASVVFIAQRGDVHEFKAYEAIDPNFAQTLRAVSTQGVGVHAYCCNVSKNRIEIAGKVPVRL
jgi:sugar fermentation stimulation protein A